MIALDRATYRRGARTLVRDVSARLEPGRVTALLGANGAGKSTLVRLLSGEIAPTHGRVLWDGADLARRSVEELARDRAVVSQQAHLAFGFRVFDVVLLGRLPHTRRPAATDAQVADAALDQVGLRAFRGRAYPTLSGGERQRVHLARALAQLHEARAAGRGVLLLDEPTAHLDLAHQQQALVLARRLAREGLAVLCVLHDVNLAAAHADLVWLMRDGHLLATGAPRAVLTADLLALALGVELESYAGPAGRCFYAPRPTAIAHPLAT